MPGKFDFGGAVAVGRKRRSDFLGHQVLGSGMNVVAKNEGADEYRRFVVRGQKSSRVKLPEALLDPSKDNPIVRVNSIRRHILAAKSMFNLDDDYEDDFELTHKGTKLGECGDSELKEDLNDISDEENDLIGGGVFVDYYPGSTGHKLSEAMTSMNFGQAGVPVPKSRGEIMKEILVKSKAIKAERAKTKYAMERMRSELDSGIKELTKELVFRSSKDDDDSLILRDNRPASARDIDRSFDLLTRQLRIEPIAEPSHRMKSEAEIELYKQQRLRLQEQERQELSEVVPARKKRKVGEESSDGDGFISDEESCSDEESSDEVPESLSNDGSDEDDDDIEDLVYESE